MFASSLRTRILEMMSKVDGTFGLVVKVVGSGDEMNINGDQVFPSASIIKIPILVEALRQGIEGDLSLDERISLREEDKVGGSGVLKELAAGLRLPLIDILTLMIIVSDNTAANMAMRRVGMSNINSNLKLLGLSKTVLQRELMDFDARNRGLENLTSPRDMCDLLEMLVSKTILDEKSCENALDIMKRQQVRDRIPRYLPVGITVAHKTGEIAGIRHDVGVVFVGKEPYVFSAMSKDLRDKLSLTSSGGKGTELIARISREVFRSLPATR